MITPRDYLSYSQKTLWKSSQKGYIDRYIHGKTFETGATRYGHKMAEALEHDEMTGDVLLDMTMAQIPKFECMDHDTHCTLEIGKDKIPLYGRMDSRKDDHSAFKEYKTGKVPWTQRKVDEDAQITFYTTMCYLITKKIPSDIELVWVETACIDKEVVCTGTIKRFHTKRTMSHIINEMADIRKVWGEIQEMCKKELL